MRQDPLFEVAGKVILAAGAAGHLGAAISQALVQRGARVIVTDIDAPGAERVAAACAEHGDAEAGILDIRDKTAVENVIDGIVGTHGRLDGIINAAGIMRIGPISDFGAEDFRESLESNTTGAYLLTQAAARAMGEDGGAVLHIASVSSLVANAQYAAYATSKAALSQLVRIAARELASSRITVNAIGPALTDTPLTNAFLADEGFRANAIAHIPMGRLGLAEDILGMAILLMAPAGAFITGQTIYVDGGRTLV